MEVIVMMDPKKNGHKKKVVALVKKVPDSCPDCGSQLIHQEGILVCRHCGYQSAPC